MVAEERRSLEKKAASLAEVFSAEGYVISAAEATMMSVLSHMEIVVTTYTQSVMYIESMLRKQLVAAIGKVHATH